MKLLNIIIVLLILTSVTLALAWFFVPESIKPRLGFTHKETVLEHARKHSDPTYVCPMHPQIIKGEPSSCPICGMDLVKKEPVIDSAPEETVLEHARKHSDPAYVCPMHPQIIKGEPSNCPICGMDLVKKEPVIDSAPKKKITKKKIKYWVAPMDANYRRDKAGKSPMGMDLVPIYEENSSNDHVDEDELPKINIKSNTAQKMGIRTQLVSKKSLSRTIHTIGSVSYNEDTLHHIHSRTNGWVEKVYVKAEGDRVKRGSTLVDFYSPDIVAAEKDLLIAKKSGQLLSQKGSGSLLESARQKLRLLDVPDSIIKKIQRTGKSQDRIPIVAPQGGVITKMGIRDGMYVTPQLQMYTIADLSSVWVLVDVFEHQLDWVKAGNKVEMSVKGLPGKTWVGKVDYIYPELSPITRTLKIRLKFDTPKQRLKPNMFANISLYSEPKIALSVPTESIIYYENSVRIVKVVGENKYQPVEVNIGMKSDGQTEILEGLQANDKIVTSGQFMIDSESNLQASFRRLVE